MALSIIFVQLSHSNTHICIEYSEAEFPTNPVNGNRNKLHIILCLVGLHCTGTTCQACFAPLTRQGLDNWHPYMHDMMKQNYDGFRSPELRFPIVRNGGFFRAVYSMYDTILNYTDFESLSSMFLLSIMSISRNHIRTRIIRRLS